MRLNVNVMNQECSHVAHMSIKMNQNEPSIKAGGRKYWTLSLKVANKALILPAKIGKHSYQLFLTYKCKRKSKEQQQCRKREYNKLLFRTKEKADDHDVECVMVD